MNEINPVLAFFIGLFIGTVGVTLLVRSLSPWHESKKEPRKKRRAVK